MTPLSRFAAALSVAMLACPAQAQESSGVAPQASFGQRLSALDLALSKTVAEPATTWRFDALQAEAQALRGVASTEVERMAIEEVESRIRRFASIAASYKQPPATVAAAWRRSTDAPRPSAPRGVVDRGNANVAPPVRRTKLTPNRADTAVEFRSPSVASTATRRGHDAEGVLRPVVSKRPDAPKYALVNAEGDVTTFVTPAPRLAARFEKLVGRRVALDGQRGYLADLRRNHLLAERIATARPLRR